MPAADQEKFLRHAVALSATASLEYSTGGDFGAVIVKDNETVSEITNRVVASHAPPWQAESVAIRPACVTLRNIKLSGCTPQYENYQCRQIAEEAAHIRSNVLGGTPVQ
jgi:guanine deaminase